MRRCLAAGSRADARRCSGPRHSHGTNSGGRSSKARVCPARTAQASLSTIPSAARGSGTDLGADEKVARRKALRSAPRPRPTGGACDGAGVRFSKLVVGRTGDGLQLVLVLRAADYPAVRLVSALRRSCRCRHSGTRFACRRPGAVDRESLAADALVHEQRRRSLMPGSRRREASGEPPVEPGVVPTRRDNSD